MSALVLPRDPTIDHDLLSDILSESITYILNIYKRCVQLQTHLAGALHAVPPEVAHHSNHTIRMTIRQQDYQ